MGTFAVLAVEKTFVDVRDHWAKDAIEVLASRHVLSGVGDGRFEPDRSVIRAEFAAMVLKALGIEIEPKRAPFRDVPASAWYSAVVGTAYASGLMKGDGIRFRPNDPITRKEMAVVLVQALRPAETAATPSSDRAVPSFVDREAISLWARPAVAYAQQRGWMSGVDGNRFLPKAPVKRAEAATVFTGSRWGRPHNARRGRAFCRLFPAGRLSAGSETSSSLAWP
ncbi:S-layer homology domain-containing protein [Hydrogenibacillus sp. N12]|uniref:S-layer homology domain-containing protein n=1 Tax=Hydrogenibacillus sp. N12 TaxID=2866627 RepID=UPI001C7DD4FC|nr:S-layer homology domain-containing protein [Hydrogenibacillus sp. N12]QZA33569.1 S-layer homology domain-containing protein [Hydrogenibacillus sp. N12]